MFVQRRLCLKDKPWDYKSQLIRSAFLHSFILMCCLSFLPSCHLLCPQISIFLFFSFFSLSLLLSIFLWDRPVNPSPLSHYCWIYWCRNRSEFSTFAGFLMPNTALKITSHMALTPRWALHIWIWLTQPQGFVNNQTSHSETNARTWDKCARLIR